MFQFFVEANIAVVGSRSLELSANKSFVLTGVHG